MTSLKSSSNNRTNKLVEYVLSDFHFESCWFYLYVFFGQIVWQIVRQLSNNNLKMRWACLSIDMGFPNYCGSIWWLAAGYLLVCLYRGRILDSHNNDIIMGAFIDLLTCYCLHWLLNCNSQILKLHFSDVARCISHIMGPFGGMLLPVLVPKLYFSDSKIAFLSCCKTYFP